MAVRVTNDALRHVRGGHPWIFDASVTRVRPDGEVGDLAVVFDDRRRFVAIGLFDPTSPIRVRVLHRGAPTTLDRVWLSQRLADAAQRRSSVSSQRTTGYRWVHGENDGLGGLIVDRYGDTVVLKVYTPAWLPHLRLIADVIGAQAQPTRVVLRLARNVAGVGDAHDGAVVVGTKADAPVEFLEGGLRFEADVHGGPKTGWFLDQRDNRARVRARSAGRSVLDVFCSGGGFSVNAAAGGARSVHSVDIAAPAIAATRRHFELNIDRANVARCRHDATVGDAREVMAHLAHGGATFDMVILDPPAFATRAAQAAGAIAAYTELTRAAMRLLEDGGTLVQASCSTHVTSPELLAAVRDGAEDSGATLVEPTVTAHAADHPVGFREGEYLAAVFARVERPRGARRRVSGGARR